jgi:hypothetical protein
MDEPLGLVRLVGVVPAGHPGDVGLGGGLVVDHRYATGQADPAVAIRIVDDRERDSGIAEQVRRPTAADRAVEHDLVVLDRVPDDGLARRPVGIDRPNRREPDVVDERADIVRDRDERRRLGGGCAGHAPDGTRARRITVRA